MFKQRKNKSFNYQSRFSKDSQGSSDSETSNKKDFISKWNRDSKPKGGVAMSMRILILVLVYY